MINVSELVSDPDLGGQLFTVLRFQNAGSFQLGGYTEQPIAINLFGVIQPSEPKALDMTPEGDRARGSISVWCSQQIYTTSSAGTSDLIIWQGNKYRVMSSNPWNQGGFWVCACVRIVAD